MINKSPLHTTNTFYLDEIIRSGLRFRSPAVALGTFDGVHLGHQAIIQRAHQMAAEEGGTPIAFTFDRHPAEIVGRGPAPLLLTDLHERLRLLEKSGVTATVLARFNRTFSRLTASQFIEDVLVGALGAHVVVCGFNFRFGQGAAGDSVLLQQRGRELGFQVAVIDQVQVGGVPISSTAIRHCLLAGQAEAAAALLGRPFRARGTVVRGEGRGQTMGFPTANVELQPGLLVPGEGVYRAKTYVEGRTPGRGYPSLAVVSRKPTFGQAIPPTLEVYLLDFSGDLYGETVAIDFLAWQRAIVPFPTPRALQEQIRKDVSEAHAYFRS